MSEYQLVKKGVLSNYLYLAVGFAWVVIMTPFILKYLGPEKYGFWAILTSIVSYLSLMSFGLNTATAKYVAEYRARKEFDALGSLTSTTVMATAAVCGLMLVIGLFASPFIPRIFHLDVDLYSTGRVAFIITCFSVSILLVGGIFGNSIYGLRRVHVWMLMRSLQLILYAVLAVVFLKLGWSLLGVVSALLVSHLVLASLYVRYLKKGDYGVRFSLCLASFSTLKQIAPYSVRTFILGMSNCLLHYKDYIIIGIFLSAAQVTPYEVLYKVCFFSTYLFSAIVSTLFPQVSELYALNEHDRLRRLYFRVAKLSLVIVSPVVLCFLFLGPSFISLWVGKENFAGYPVLFALVAMVVLHAIGTPSVSILQGIGKNKYITYSEVINAGLNLTISLILVRKYGILGVALGTLIASCLTSSWVVVYLLRRYLELSVVQYLRQSILPPLICGAIIGACVWTARGYIPAADTWPLFIAECAGIVLLYGILYAAVFMRRDEYLMYRRIFSRSGSEAERCGSLQST